MRPRFLDLQTHSFSLLRVRLLVSQTAPGHLCVNCETGFVA